MPADSRAELRADRPVQHGDAAERRHRIGRERALPGLLDRLGHRDPAGICVLDDHRAGQLQLAGDAPGAFEIAQVVVRELLAAELLDPREQVPAGAELAIVRRRLVGVLAVREVGDLAEGDRELFRERLRAAEPVRDRRLIRRRRLERLAREPLPRLRRRVAVLAQLRQDVVVLRRAGDDGDVREVLRRGAEHRRAADVDHLDDLGLGRVGQLRDPRERVQRDADEVDEVDLLLLESLHVLVELAPREDAGMDARVERLDAAAQHLGSHGDRLHGGDGQAGLGQERRGASGRDELPAELGEAARELVDAFLVVDADQCAARHSSLTTSGSSRCSAAWTRARRVSTVSPGRTGTLSAAMTAPVSTPPSM